MEILNKDHMKNIFITSDLLEPLSDEEVEYYFREKFKYTNRNGR